ncbi:uncharacterized protein LOC18029739 [Eutrema salsugineum]|uniref:uncharacterized protein LOC18029739 n=1 Tax=Eutrema salsugineum TaxID=72664 RepID=UPI000CED42E7|nr:uncharacterized protein LOC18029739 [Eutrema salsugineum]
MTESCDLMYSKARGIVESPSDEGLATLVDQLFINRKDTDEYKTAKALFDLCFKTFQDGLTRKLLMVYRDSSIKVLRLRSIFLISQNLKIELSLDALQEIKPIVISCLTRQEHKGYHEAKIFGTIVSLVANNVKTFNNGGWDELSDCILSLAGTQPLKAFHVFLGLPPIKNWEFLNRFKQRVVVEAEKMLADPDQEEYWLLALETIAKIGVQVLNSEDRYESVKSSILTILVKSATELEKINGMRQILLRGLEKFLSRDNNLYKYNEDQYRFVSELTSELGKRSFEFYFGNGGFTEASCSGPRIGNQNAQGLTL